MSDNSTQVRLADASHRLVVIGRTGTGKTQAGLWHLSLKNFRKFPWIMYDAKGDELMTEISKIPGVQHIGFDHIPKHPGLYYIRATPPAMKSEAMEAMLWRIHSKKNTGLFFDEGFPLDPRSGALNTIYTQGRSLRIPTITLTQRPSWLSRFTFTQADFFQLFALNDADDRKTVKKFIPVDSERDLPRFHSWWYDVADNRVAEFSPVPTADAILENFETNVRKPKFSL